MRFRTATTQSGVKCTCTLALYETNTFMASVCANDAVPLSDAPSKKKKKKKKKNKKKKKKGDANDDKVFRVVERAGRGRCVIT